MRLLVLTGAGASHNLAALPDEPLPLMEDWARRFRERIGPDLTSMSTLDRAESGIDFEKTLGALFAWEAGLDEMERFAAMASSTTIRDNTWTKHARNVVRHSRVHMSTLTSHLHGSLFDEFGPERVDPEAAKSAYGQLLQGFGGPNSPTVPKELIFATTNYDRSLEIALAELGSEPYAGFVPQTYRTPELVPEGLGNFEPGRPKVIYLHGAVGWYRSEAGTSSIVSLPADAGFNETLGRPAVLYPDPSKEIETSETAMLWREFQVALGNATHVLIIGHALNDAYVKKEILAAAETCSVGYVVHAAEPESKEARQKVERKGKHLPGVHMIAGDFGPELQLDNRAWMRWIKKARASS